MNISRSSYNQLMRAFRESGALKPVADSFRQGWREAQRGKTAPEVTLWDAVEAE